MPTSLDEEHPRCFQARGQEFGSERELSLLSLTFSYLACSLSPSVADLETLVSLSF
jgi:hypothetical protein